LEITIGDTATKGPVYQQIKDQVTELIQAGTLVAGEALPSPASLAAKANVDRGEVSRAYFELEQLGLIASKKSKNFLGESTVVYSIL
jgi:GntR family transcriptional regulator